MIGQASVAKVRMRWAMPQQLGRRRPPRVHLPPQAFYHNLIGRRESDAAEYAMVCHSCAILGTIKMLRLRDHAGTTVHVSSHNLNATVAVQSSCIRSGLWQTGSSIGKSLPGK